MWNWFDLVKIGVTAVVAFLLGRVSRRLDRRQDRKDAEAKRAPDFELKPVGGVRFRLVNTGDADATGVTLNLAGHPEDLARDVPRRIDLAEGEGHSLQLRSSFSTRLPDQLWVVGRRDTSGRGNEVVNALVRCSCARVLRGRRGCRIDL